MAEAEPIYVDGRWRSATSAAPAYQSVDPAVGEAFGPAFPVSGWADLDAALQSAAAARPLPSDARAELLEAYASAIERDVGTLAALAARETGLPAEGRFERVEIPRTVDQLRQAARSARTGDWSMPTIDVGADIRSCLGPLGVVATFGPVNFPFAYNAIAGGDFASAIAAGNSVIGRAHPSHPQTTRALMHHLVVAASEVNVALPVQLLYGFSNDDGLRLAGDRRLAAIGFTGSRGGGLALKAACDAAGVLFFGELSSINPVVITPAALRERCDIVESDYLASVLLAGGQMCTNPGLVLLIEGEETHRFIDRIRARFDESPPAVLLNRGIVDGLEKSVGLLLAAGAERVTGGRPVAGGACRFENTLLTVSGATFLRTPQAMQAEMFGNACLFVLCQSEAELIAVTDRLEGNLCGSIYLARDEGSSTFVRTVWASLRGKVGRLLTDKMPTGVAVTPAMNHGGPYPSTGHPGFTAVGFPAAIRRFAKLECFDHVRHDLLPPVLRDENPTGAWRLVNGNWTREAVHR